ncbi:MAG: metal ABC transporter substrate-binding protein [Lachnospiraceae bacterium]|nr:metal ABC transporter substrate-binding protein [Lachnospiraceae bacterium]
MKKRKAIFMVCLLSVAFGITALIAGLAEKKEKTDGMLCVTSFYPVYLLAESVAEGAIGVQVENLTENHSGCIHDYTLTTQDMRLLSEAELFLINGGEMELFLERAAKEYKNLRIVDTSEGYSFLEGVEHNHAHEDESEVHGAEGRDELHEHEDGEHTGEGVVADHAEEDHDGHNHTLNAHLWMDIDGYLLQLSKVEEAFVTADSAQEAVYRRNAERCREELLVLKAEYETAREQLAGGETVVFHEGFVYLFRMLGIETVHCLAMDSDTQIASGEAAQILEECKLHGITTLFAEEEYVETVQETFAKAIDGSVVVLNPVTGGTGLTPGTAAADGDTVPDAADTEKKGIALYCESMRKNLNRIKQAYGVQ